MVNRQSSMKMSCILLCLHHTNKNRRGGRKIKQKLNIEREKSKIEFNKNKSAMAQSHESLS